MDVSRISKSPPRPVHLGPAKPAPHSAPAQAPKNALAGLHADSFRNATLSNAFPALAAKDSAQDAAQARSNRRPAGSTAEINPINETKLRRATALLEQKQTLGDLTPPHVELELRQLAHELGPHYPGAEGLPHDQPPPPASPKALAEFHAQHYAQLQARLAGKKPDLSKVLARTQADLQQARQGLAELGVDPEQTASGFTPQAIQTPKDPQEAREMMDHCVTLLGLHLRRIEKLQETRLVLRDLTPSHVPLEIQTEGACIERLRQQMKGLGLDLGAPASRAELGHSLADQFGQQKARQLLRTLSEVPQGQQAFGPWEPEWVAARAAGHGEAAAPQLAMYELYRFHADYYDAMARNPGSFDVAGAVAEAQRRAQNEGAPE